MRKIFFICIIVLISASVQALTSDQHNAMTTCYLHSTSQPKTPYGAATYKPGYEKCYELMPTLLTMQAAETAIYKQQQEDEDNKLFDKVSRQILPKEQK
jgi:hypothetical protein